MQLKPRSMMHKHSIHVRMRLQLHIRNVSKKLTLCVTQKTNCSKSLVSLCQIKLSLIKQSMARSKEHLLQTLQRINQRDWLLPVKSIIRLYSVHRIWMRQQCIQTQKWHIIRIRNHCCINAKLTTTYSVNIVVAITLITKSIHGKIPKRMNMKLTWQVHS